jgi:hypothetical protein
MQFFQKQILSFSRTLLKDDFKDLMAGINAIAFVLGSAAMVFLVLQPTDPGKSFLLGFSLSRLVLISLAALYAGAQASVFLINRKNPAIHHRLINKLSISPHFSKILAWLAILALFLLLYLLFLPQSGLRGTYPQVFEKLVPFFLLLIFSVLQILLLLLLIYLNKVETEKNACEKIRFLSSKYLIPAGLFLFPFLFFFPRTIPVKDEFFIIGNDFIPISYTYKVYLLDFLSRMQFPLWSPSEAAGFPFFSSPFPQPFYPLNIPLAIGYLLNGGYSILDHQRFAVLGVSIFALGIYYWLRQFKLSLPAVATAALIAPVSFKISELIRYPIGLHTAAWYPWILLAMTLILKRKKGQSVWLGGILLVVSLYCLLTAGYLYFLYYSFFLFLPYLAIFLFPRMRTAFFPDQKSVSRANYRVLILSALAAGMISSPYLLHQVNLIRSVSARSGDDFQFSTAHVFNPMDTLGSLIFPPMSQTEGWYYFSLGALLLILLFLGSSLLRLQSPEEKAWYQRNRIKFYLVAWIAIISYITYGQDSVIFNFLWHYMPFFSTLRTWGRLNIVLVPLIALLISISTEFLLSIFQRLPENDEGGGKVSFQRYALVLSSIYIPVLLIQLLLFAYGQVDRYWETYFYLFYRHKVFFLYSGFAAYALLLSGGFLFLKNRLKVGLIGIHCIFCIIATLDLWHVGAYSWWAGTMTTGEDARTAYNIPGRIIPESLLYNREVMLQPSQVSLKPTFSVGYAVDWYFQDYLDFYHAHNFEKEQRSILLSVDGWQRIFLSRAIDYETISAFLDDSTGYAGEYEVDFFNGDRLELTVHTEENGYISYIDNWDPYWQATVNGIDADVEKLFNAFKAVRVEEGTSKVIFHYKPSLFPSFSQ